MQEIDIKTILIYQSIHNKCCSEINSILIDKVLFLESQVKKLSGDFIWSDVDKKWITNKEAPCAK